MRVLVDTSVWSCALRRRKVHDKSEAAAVVELKSLVEGGNVVVIGVIRQEILSGIRNMEQYLRLREALSAFPDIPVETGDFERAAEMFNLCRSRGIQASNTDFLICSVAESHGFDILTLDRDFSLLAGILPISVYFPGNHQ